MKSPQAASQETHTSEEAAVPAEDPKPMSGMPDWMREDFERGCARIRGRVATMQILADDALAHQESRMAMANQ